jgi:hypothetical protein
MHKHYQEGRLMGGPLCEVVRRTIIWEEIARRSQSYQPAD